MVINSRVEAPDWRYARCRKFPLPSRKAGTLEDDPWFKQAVDAIDVCNGFEPNGADACPARADCLLFSLINNEGRGVWGGLTAPQRKWLRRYVPRDRWNDDAYLRERVPPPEHFKDLGDEDDDEDA